MKIRDHLIVGAQHREGKGEEAENLQFTIPSDLFKSCVVWENGFVVWNKFQLVILTSRVLVSTFSPISMDFSDNTLLSKALQWTMGSVHGH